LIEWDDEIPEFPVLAAEAEKVERLRELALGPDAAPLDRFVVPRPTEESAPSEASPSHGWQQGGPRSPAPYELVTSETFVTQEAE
jgi:hypothetical protein